MTTSFELFWDLFQRTGSPEAYLLYRETAETIE